MGIVSSDELWEGWEQSKDAENKKRIDFCVQRILTQLFVGNVRRSAVNSNKISMKEKSFSKPLSATRQWYCRSK